MKNNLFNRLQKDHQTIKKELEENLGDSAIHKPDIEELCHFYLSHLAMEENLIYPLLEVKRDTQPLVEESQVEHRETKQLIDMILQDNLSDISTKEHLELLQLNLEQHMFNTEHRLFPRLKEIVPHEKLEQLSKEFELIRKNHVPVVAKARHDHRWFERLFSPR